MNYAETLDQVMNETPAATGLKRAEIEAGIAAISTRLTRPCGDAERILLCADRASLRKALAALPVVAITEARDVAE